MTGHARPSNTEWIRSLKAFEGSGNWKGIGQFALTFSLYAVLIAGMLGMVLRGLPYWAVLLAALPAGGLHMKLFIIMHDCGHNSFMRSKRISTAIGRICALATFTPYYDWRRAHAIHHATVSNLDRRGTGDVWTLTAEEFKASPGWKRFLYRIYRNPVFFFGIGPLLLFLVVFRFPRKDTTPRCNRSIIATNIAIAGIIIAFWSTIGILPYIFVMLPVLIVAGFSGVWLFFIQHQFEDVYWDRSEDWNLVRAALEGSSFCRLPAVLRWFSGNIGYHHIHHLNPRIPNFHLRRCFLDVPEVQAVNPITLWTGLKSMVLGVWDEKSRKLVSFRTMNRIGTGDART